MDKFPKNQSLGKRTLFISKKTTVNLLTCNLNPFQPSVTFYIKTSQLFCRAPQMTGFYMQCNTGLKWVKLSMAFYLITFLKIDFKSTPETKISLLNLLSKNSNLFHFSRHLS